MRTGDFLNEAGGMPIYYFAYGMLTDPLNMESAELIGPATLNNHELRFNLYADVIEQGGSRVYGVLWSIPDGMLRQLDRVENYPDMYGRKVVPVFHNGKKYEAIMYYMTPLAREELDNRPPLKRYLSSIVSGYRNAGLPLRQLEQALTASKTVDEAAMNPSDFRTAIEKSGAEGILIGFEFEVIVPKKVIQQNTLGQQQPDVKFLKNFFFGDRSLNDVQPIDLHEVELDKLSSLLKFRNPIRGYNNFKDYLIANISARVEKMKKIYETVPNELKDRYGGLALKYANTLEEHTFDKAKELAYGYRFGQLAVQTELFNLGVPAVTQYFLELFGTRQPAQFIRKFQNDIDYDINGLEDWGKEIGVFDEEDFRDNYKGAVEVLKPAIEQTFGRRVRVFTEYHQKRKNLTDWYIEPDGSLDVNERGDGTAEVVSPPYPGPWAVKILQSFGDLCKQKGIKTNSSTGLHINMSIPKNIDLLKLALFVGDNYVLKQFNREFSPYAREVYKDVSNRLAGGREFVANPPTYKLPEDTNVGSNLKNNILNLMINRIAGEHTASISNNGKYISFRHAGGDYLNDLGKLEQTIGRFTRALLIATDPNAYTQEYRNKLGKMIAAEPLYPKLANNKKQWQVYYLNKIKQNGLPKITVLGYLPSESITQSNVNRFRSNILNRYLEINRNDYEILDSVNGAQAKSEFLSFIEEKDDDAIKDSASQFIKFSIVPNNITSYQQLEQGIKNVKFGQKITAYTSAYNYLGEVIFAKVEILPFNSTQVQAIWKEYLKGVYATDVSKKKSNLVTEDESLPNLAQVKQLIPKILQAAQRNYDEWDEQDRDTYAGGGICHIIADSICDLLGTAGIDSSPVSCSYEQHVYVAARLAEGVYTIDIPYHIYEQGGGFTWHKLPDVVFEPSDVVFYRVSSDPNDFDEYIQEDYDPNGPPPGPETKPTMPAGTVRVDVSDVYDWYKLGQHISNLKGLGKHDFGQGPPSTIMAFGSEPEEHKYIKNLEKTGLTTTDIDPRDKNQPKGMKPQKVDPTFNVAENFDKKLGEADKKFVGFMNKALGTQVDKPVYQQNKSEVMGLHNMPGYSKALAFGLKTIRAMDSETQLQFAQADDHEFLQYLIMLATKKRYIPRLFAEEDLEEVDTVFDEAFHDPNMIGWTWADLLRDHIGVPVRAVNRASALAHIERQRQADIEKARGPKPISLDLLYVNEPHHKKPDAEIWYSNQDGTARVVASGYKDRAEAEAALARLKKDPKAIDIIKNTRSGPRKISDPGPGIYENFADGQVKGKSRPGRVKRAGASCDGTVSELRARAKKYGGERGKMYHWCANMKSGKQK